MSVMAVLAATHRPSTRAAPFCSRKSTTFRRLRRTSRDSTLRPCGCRATASRDMTSAPAPACGFRQLPCPTTSAAFSCSPSPERPTARQYTDVVPKSTARANETGFPATLSARLPVATPAGLPAQISAGLLLPVACGIWRPTSVAATSSGPDGEAMLSCGSSKASLSPSGT